MLLITLISLFAATILAQLADKTGKIKFKVFTAIIFTVFITTLFMI